MSSPINYSSYKFLVGALSTHELVGLYKGDAPGYLQAKLTELGMELTDTQIQTLIETYLLTTTKFIWKRAITQPDTPVGDEPTGTDYGDWQESPYAHDSGENDYDYLWMSTGTISYTGSLVGDWTDPVPISGDSGYTTKFVYAAGIDDTTAPPTPTGDAPQDDGDQDWEEDETDIDDYNDDIFIWRSKGVFRNVKSASGTGSLVDTWGDPVFIRRTGIERTVFIFKRAVSVPDVPTEPELPEHPGYGDWQYEPYSYDPMLPRDVLWTSRAILIGDTFKDEGWSDPPTQIEGNSITQYDKHIFRADSELPSGGSLPPNTLDTGDLGNAGWFEDPADAIDQYIGEGKILVYACMGRVITVNEVESLVDGWGDPYQYTGDDGKDGDDGDDANFAVAIPTETFIISEASDGDEIPNKSSIPVGIIVSPDITGDVTFASDQIEIGSDILDSGSDYMRDLNFNDVTSFPVEITISSDVGEFDDIVITIPKSIRIENAISVILTNENHTFTIPSSGTITYSNGICDVEVYRGSHQLQYNGSITSTDEFTIENIVTTNISAANSTIGKNRRFTPSAFADEPAATITFDVVVPCWEDYTTRYTFHKQITYSKASVLPDYEATILSLNNQITALESAGTILEDEILNLKDTIDNTSNLQGLIATAIGANPDYFREVLNVNER